VCPARLPNESDVTFGRAPTLNANIMSTGQCGYSRNGPVLFLGPLLVTMIDKPILTISEKNRETGDECGPPAVP
jgi:hypothetical protein